MSKPDDLRAPTQDELFWLADATQKLHSLNVWGEMLSLVPRLLLECKAVGYHLEFIADLLARITTDPLGSIDGDLSVVASDASRYGRKLPVKEARVRSLVGKDAIPATEEWFQTIHQSQWLGFNSNRRPGDKTVAQIDELQVPFSGRDSKAYKSGKAYRAKAKTEAGRMTVPAKPGRFFDTTVAHEYIVATGTKYPLQTTTPLAWRFRPPVGKGRSKTTLLGDLLASFRDLRPIPDLSLGDKGFAAGYADLRTWVRETAKTRAMKPGGNHHFVVPMKKGNSGKMTDDTDVATKDAMWNQCESARYAFETGIQPVPNTEYVFSQMTAGIQGAKHERVRMVFFYKLKREVKDAKPADIDFDDVTWHGFYTDYPVNDENVAEFFEFYGMRWNCENYYQKALKILGIIPSDAMAPRVTSFGLVMSHMAQYAFHRARRYAQTPLGDEALTSELPRLRDFFKPGRADMLRNLLNQCPVPQSKQN